ncbi:linoleate 9S-lipoxygenase 5-like isoform X1 [Abrus precatorius]|uniref:Lipoxygenase n=1 Tax=Abrus precatorius TaxID=3816 RepID=A0A8B8MJM8_ABRPR|nr:linoleate 9S-lipoxygenase 5-like isoform X1 [Abrus precatorius]XP_027367451.1 linoleate 9S-lipoxygenase 5-like isoform X1 [Abrus precatorius]XP_027367452.1 linoleate 9S-lipoxygenase 5-like isoform X1 [Abrus precatorius]XP_027367453.1 linoleate 9S-lipoxygenase 5-like isoform X1 [Abrus precatorius]
MNHRVERTRLVKGRVVLMKKGVLDFHDIKANVLDRIHELLGRGVSLQLISATTPDPAKGLRGKHGKVAYLERWLSTISSLTTTTDTEFSITFEWDESMGVPGAFMIRNHHHSQFYLKTVTIEDIPGYGPVNFVCNSWVYPAHRYKYDRVFFANKAYLPSETPEPLRKFREEELIVLRGKGYGKLYEWDRVYDYAYYNDLGTPDSGPDYARPVLGGSHFPYPRRGRTSRPHTKTDPKTESRLHLLNLNIYVPRDEQFGRVKFSDFLAYSLKSVAQVLLPELKSVCDKTINEFDTFEDVLDVFEGCIKLPSGPIANKLRELIPYELLRELVRNDGERFLKFPVPDVIKASKTAWRTDEEFGREMLAGVNPVIIRRLQEFPPASKLDPRVYGDQTSSIRATHIENSLDGFTIDEALQQMRLFILDHHDALMPYISRINSTNTKTYATRTLLFLQDDGTLKPLAIELSLPHPQGEQHGAVSKVFTAAQEGIAATVWQLAKAYAAVNDSGYHQLVSHWLYTHAVIEPFIIATNRQLSILHPIHKLLKPHFRDTMHINALARHTLINAGGVLEKTVFPGKFALEMSAIIYKSWVFTEQALPADLLKRGMAVQDSSCPHGLRLVIEDYPFAVDGLEIWEAILTWVTEYCNFYYTSDEMVESDTELKNWWKELRNEGHGDLKDKPWWPEMKTREELIQSCTIIIWLASAFHAAVNFGQYPFAGYLPNRPTVSRRFMPEPGTPEYEELKTDPDLAFLKTITAQFQTLLGVSLIEVLSRHSTEEFYLGQTDNPDWTLDAEPLAAFQRFSQRLMEIENNIMERNKDKRLKNRNGPVKMPYTLLYPNTSDYSREGGLTGKGIPNSISI